LRPLLVNHTGVKSGAEASLLDLVSGMRDDVHPLVACPAGELADALRERGVDVHLIPAIEASFRLHPLQTPRGTAQILRSALAVRRAARRHGADIVHANSIRAGLAATVACVGGGPPVIVHVRDCLPDSRAGNMTRRVIAHAAASVLANSHYTAANFARNADQADVQVVYSPVDLERFDPDRIDPAQARGALGLGPEPVFAVVGQITPWKGQSTGIEALALLRQRVPLAKLLIAGAVKFSAAGTRHDNPAYLRSLRQMVSRLGVGDDVVFMGERRDVAEILRAIDVLLVPSWEEPFGRTMVEAMAMRTPVIATTVGGPPEVIEDGQNGRLVAPQAPEAWSRAMEDLIADRELLGEMGESAHRTAMRFNRDTHVERILAVYREVLA
jgi:glycosyltransferase involved in cell wall biosynthesis